MCQTERGKSIVNKIKDPSAQGKKSHKNVVNTNNNVILLFIIIGFPSNV